MNNIREKRKSRVAGEMVRDSILKVSECYTRSSEQALRRSQSVVSIQ